MCALFCFHSTDGAAVSGSFLTPTTFRCRILSDPPVPSPKTDQPCSAVSLRQPSYLLSLQCVMFCCAVDSSSADRVSAAKTSTQSASTASTSKASKLSGDEKKPKTIQKDPHASEVFKSLFNTHKTAKQQQHAHWVTYNPQYF